MTGDAGDPPHAETAEAAEDSGTTSAAIRDLRVQQAAATYHVLAVPDRPSPRLLVRQDGGDGLLVSLPLDGAFDLRVGPVRRCVGRFGEGGQHQPCPTAEPVSQHRQCRPCSGLEDPECVFEPRCRSDPAACTCVATFKGVPHVVYLAFFGTLPKVGITQAWRVEGRLREQGADAWFAVQQVPDRGTARQVESQVSFLYGYPEHRSHLETLRQLARPVPWDVVERRADECRLRLEGSFDVERALHRITDHPLPQPLDAVPHRVPVEGRHAGTWLGAKGTHLVYRGAPRADQLHVGRAPLAALKRSDLVGRRVTFALGGPAG